MIFSGDSRAALLATTVLVSVAATPAMAQQSSGQPQATTDRATLIAVAPTLPAPPSGSSASVPATSQGPDIIVTARRREERLFDVPVAVSVLGQRDIGRYATDTMAKVAEVTPGLNIGQRTAGGAGAGITIRGVGTDGSNVGIAQSVSISIDGVQTSQGRALLSSFFDTQQIEVMKGPQALYFGKNSPAGVIALTSANPTDRFEAGATVGYEFHADEAIADSYISGPLGGGFKGRLAIRARDMKGYVYNDARPLDDPSAFAPYNHLPGAINHRDGERELAGRLTLNYDRGGSFNATLKATGDRYRDDGAVYPLELVYCGGNFPRDFVSLFGTPHHDPVGNCVANWRTASSDHPYVVAASMEHGLRNNGAQYSAIDTFITSFVMNYHMSDALTLTSTTGYYMFNSANLMNNDWTSFATIGGTEAQRFRQFSQEVRLSSDFHGPLNFMIGGYYEHEYVHFDGSIKLDSLPVDQATGKYQTIDKLGINHDNTYSAFAQLSYKIVPELELSGGARYTHETAKGGIGNTYSHPLVRAFFPVHFVPAGDTSNNVSPEVTLTYRPNREFMIYGAYKTGYKSGGINLSQVVTAGVTTASASFKKETAQGFEAGIKTKLLDGKASLQLTAYRYNFKGLQVSAWVPQLQSYVVSNAAASRSYGVELEATYHPVRELNLHSALAYNHSRYLSFPNAACYGGQPVGTGLGECSATGQDLSGRPTLSAPDWVITAGFDYDHPVGDYVIGASADAYYSSSYYYIQTQAPEATQGDFVRFNAALRLSPSSQKWTVSLIGRNLTNRKVLVSGQDTPLAGNNGNPTALNGVLARPREVLLQGSIKF